MAADDKAIAENAPNFYTVNPGTYIITEVDDGNYTLTSITGDNDSDASNGATVTVESGEIKNLTFINQQHKATITVVKDVAAPDGITVVR
ncbi:MAG: hypothetical protein U5N58_11590 [Actinomycetota bacterium]|nr:hypothetical protein [Actinomycetota bacterium]